MPPASLTARTPSAPSEPAPLRMTANPSPSCSASERKNRSIGARWPRGSSKCSDCDLVIDYLQSAVRRNDVDVVGFQSLTFADLHNGHLGARRDDARHFAVMLRIKMHDDDKGGAGARRQRRRKSFATLEHRRPTRR